MATDLPDLTIRQLEYLVAVAEAPTWAAAAERVGVSPSALSQGLAELERRVGVALFDRVGRRRELRSSATEVLAHARQVIALTSDLARWVERTQAGTAGRLRVGMIDAAAVGHYADDLRRFRDAHPDLELRLAVAPSGSLLADLVAGRLDLVVCVEPSAPPPGVDLEALLTEDIAVYGPGGAALDEPARWGPWVLMPDGSHTREIVDGALAELGVSVDVVAESHQPEVLRAMVDLGLGWTALPVSQGETGSHALAPGRVVARRTLVAATRSGAAPDPAADRLLGGLADRGASHRTNGSDSR